MPKDDVATLEARLEHNRTALAQSLYSLTRTLAPEALAQSAENCAAALGQTTLRGAGKHPAAFVLMGAGLALLAGGAVRQQHQTAGPTAPSGQMHADSDAGLDGLEPDARAHLRTLRQKALEAQVALEAHTRTTADETAPIAPRHVATGVAAFGAGALVAAALPRTDPEDTVLGAQRDRLMQAAARALHTGLGARQATPAPDPGATGCDTARAQGPGPTAAHPPR